jgi:hypothetical protein
MYWLRALEQKMRQQSVGRNAREREKRKQEVRIILANKAISNTRYPGQLNFKTHLVKSPWSSMVNVKLGVGLSANEHQKDS